MFATPFLSRKLYKFSTCMNVKLSTHPVLLSVLLSLQLDNCFYFSLQSFSLTSISKDLLCCDVKYQPHPRLSNCQRKVKRKAQLQIGQMGRNYGAKVKFLVKLKNFNAYTYIPTNNIEQPYGWEFSLNYRDLIMVIFKTDFKFHLIYETRWR